MKELPRVKRTVTVVGATGQQGGAAARLLLARGHTVRALTRDPMSSSALAVAAAGASLVAGSLDDPRALDQALEGADALFAMTTHLEAGPGWILSHHWGQQ